MQINVECEHCMNASVAPSETALCPHCQKPLRTRAALPASNVLVAEAHPKPHGLRFDLESVLALSAFALIAIVAILFLTHFHV